MVVDNRANYLKNAILENLKGGKGSGNFNHSGRPGEIGGSARSGSVRNIYSRIKKPNKSIYGRAIFDENGEYLSPENSILHNVNGKKSRYANYSLSSNPELRTWFVGRIGSSVTTNVLTENSKYAGQIEIRDRKTGEYIILDLSPDYFISYIGKEKTSAAGVLGVKTVLALRDLSDFTLQPVSLINANPRFWSKFPFLKGVRGEDSIELRYDPREYQHTILKEAILSNMKGGPGSGNFGHQGRPGKVGGSSSKKIINLVSVDDFPAKANFVWSIKSDPKLNSVDNIAYVLPDGSYYTFSGGTHNGIAGMVISATDNKQAFGNRNDSAILVSKTGAMRIISDNSSVGFEISHIGITRAQRSFIRKVFKEERDFRSIIIDVVGEDGKVLINNDYYVEDLLNASLKGGAGSGHYGHQGRPGKVGGSSSAREKPLSQASRKPQINYREDPITTEFSKNLQIPESLYFEKTDKIERKSSSEWDSYVVLPDNTILRATTDRRHQGIGRSLAHGNPDITGFYNYDEWSDWNEYFLREDKGYLNFSITQDEVALLSNSIDKKTLKKVQGLISDGVIKYVPKKRFVWESRSGSRNYIDTTMEQFYSSQKIEIVDTARRLTLKELILRKFKGGPGSGNFGHRGRPGKVGGSARAGISDSPLTPAPKWESGLPRKIQDEILDTLSKVKTLSDFERACNEKLTPQKGSITGSPEIDSAIREFHEKHHDASIENSIIFNSYTNEVITKKTGDEDSVAWSDAEALEISNKDAILIHNHPGKRSLSLEDVAFCYDVGIKSIIATSEIYANDGGTKQVFSVFEIGNRRKQGMSELGRQNAAFASQVRHTIDSLMYMKISQIYRNVASSLPKEEANALGLVFSNYDTRLSNYFTAKALGEKYYEVEV